MVPMIELEMEHKNLAIDILEMFEDFPVPHFSWKKRIFTFKFIYTESVYHNMELDPFKVIMIYFRLPICTDITHQVTVLNYLKKNS
jgi:hypothetical protein